ncbi:MAG: hypothetical protein GX175_07600 [Halanaerobiaceae bacterium]|nr:hypothetical protein [Halanaerobiaceae bacterium]
MSVKKLRKIGLIFLVFGIVFIQAACSGGKDDKPAAVTIKSVEEIAIEVAYGTTAEQAIEKLPANVKVTLSNNKTKDAQLTGWTAPENYNGEVPGEYIFTSKFSITEGTADVKAKVIVLEEGETPKDPGDTGELTVKDIKILNDRQINVIFDNGFSRVFEVDELFIGENEVTFEYNGQAFKELLVATVKDLSEIVITFDTDNKMEDGTPYILAQKYNTTMVTAQIFTKGKLVQDVDGGTINFDVSTGGGSFGQEESLVANGKADAQITAANYVEITEVTVKATLKTTNRDYDGLEGQTKILFVPPAYEEEIIKLARVVHVAGNQNDRVFVTFSSAVNVSNLDVNSIKIRDGVTKEYCTVKCFNQLADNIIELILDTDSDEKNALTDNVQHTLFVEYIPNVVIEMSMDFILTDTKPQRVKRYVQELTDQRTITLEFEEAVAKDTDGDIKVWDANRPENYVVNGNRLVYEYYDTADYDEEQALVESIKVGEYDPVTGEDRRNIVTIRLSKYSQLKEKNSIQIINVGDWAARSDQHNMITSAQTIQIDIELIRDKPLFTLEQQSVEQYLLTVDQDVELVSGVEMKDVFAIYYGPDEDGNYNEEKSLEYGTDYAVTVADRKYYIELTRDWVDILGSLEDKTNTYDAPDNCYLTIIVKENSFENFYGIRNDHFEETTKMEHDPISPVISNVEDVTLSGTGEVFRITMSEPCQLVIMKDDGTIDYDNSTSPLTPAPRQEIPTYSIYFKNEAKEVTCEILKGSIAEDDMSFLIAPVTPLEAGEWTLYITSIADDVGNTISTESYPFIVEKDEEEIIKETRTQVLWARYVHPRHDSKKRIEIKFSTVMKSIDANSVFRTENYLLNNISLPAGSSITKGISGVTNDFDGVTITLPESYLDYDGYMILNVASNVEAAALDLFLLNLEPVEPVETEMEVKEGEDGKIEEREIILPYVSTWINQNFADGESYILGAKGITDADGNLVTILLELSDVGGQIALEATRSNIDVNGVHPVSVLFDEGNNIMEIVLSSPLPADKNISIRLESFGSWNLIYNNIVPIED